MDRRALALLAACACGSRSEPPARAPAITPAATTVAVPRQVAPSDATKPVAEPVPVPDFAKLDIDVDAAFPLLTKIRRAGSVYETHDGPALATGHGGAVLMPEQVIDPDRGGSPRRPRLLCTNASYRLALFVDAEDLATMATVLAFIAPTAAISVEQTAETPGLRVAPGTILDPLDDAAGGAQLVRYDGLFLDVDGWIDASSVDVVHQRGTLDDDPVRDAELERAVSLRAAPSNAGKVLGRITKEPKVANELLVRKLGRPRRGFQLIRYTEEDAVVVGWVPSSALRSFPTRTLDGSRGFGIGGGTGQTQKTVRVPRGTLLVGRTSQEILGVVTTDDDLPCDKACEEDDPILRLYACTASVPVKIRRQSSASRHSS